MLGASSDYKWLINLAIAFLLMLLLLTFKQNVLYHYTTTLPEDLEHKDYLCT